MKKPKTVLELFEGHANRWIKRALARTGQHGKVVEVQDPKARCFCLSGAIYRVYGFNKRMLKARQKLLAVLNEDTVVEFNDTKGRTFKQVLAKVREAGI